MQIIPVIVLSTTLVLLLGAYGKAATVGGRVLDSNGKTGEGITVGISGRDSSGNSIYRKRVKTDKEGKFKFEDAPAGSYVLVAHTPLTPDPADLGDLTVGAINARFTIHLNDTDLHFTIHLKTDEQFKADDDARRGDVILIPDP